MRRGPARVVLMLVLLTSASFLQVAPPAAAQSLAVVCFPNGDRLTGAGTCAADAPPPNYRQGDEVYIAVHNVAGAPWVKVHCVEGCPAADSSAVKNYYARWRGDTLRFPRDFTESGPTGATSVGNAVLDKAPRYNATWAVTVSLEDTPLATRTFNTWLLDLYTAANMTLRPGANHFIRATGFEPGGSVDLRVERRAGGEWLPVLVPARKSASASGRLELSWDVPKDEAAHIVECGTRTHDCYRIVARGTGKHEEIVSLPVDVAEIRRDAISTPPPPPTERAIERTQNASVEIDLRYPGGRLATGPRLTPDDLPVSPAFGEKALRVVVEKVNLTSRDVVPLHEIPMRQDPARLVWTAEWTVPKDLPPEPGAIYRLRLADAVDRWGNRIPGEPLGNFTISNANLLPVLVVEPSRLPRTQEGVFSFVITYYDGTPFTPAENATPLRGCFVRESATPAPDCAGVPQVEATYWANGTWNFSTRYPRDYEALEPHRLIVANGTRDRWNNLVLGTRSDAFDVVVGSPTIEFQTVMRGRATEVLERGYDVSVQARITYGDGHAYNHSLRPNESAVIAATLTKRGPVAPGEPLGAIQSVERFDLVEVDPWSGLWMGTLQLRRDDTTTPVGLWTFDLDIRDNLTVPNRNRTSFDRLVEAAGIELVSTFAPHSRIETNQSQRFRFQLVYDKGGQFEPVSPEALGSRVSAGLYRWNPVNQTAYGPQLSGTLQPLWNEQTKDWGIDYVIPKELYSGQFVFVVRGEDVYGNKLRDATSRPFSTFAAVMTRSVIVEPPPEVRRGESATVVFDAREGDMGVPGPRALPRIQLERFDPGNDDCDAARQGHEKGCWVREVADVRSADESLDDHVGVFPVTLTTPVGLYRFALQGRDADYRIITGVSANFTVNATEVTRAIYQAPPESVLKGLPVTFKFEYQNGDRITDKAVYYNGQPLTIPGPSVTFETEQTNVTWSPPFDVPTGNYSILVRGRDINGNLISFFSPAFEIRATTLSGKVLGEPARVVTRGESISVVFGILYPDGSFYLAPDNPRVYVVDGERHVGEATVERVGLAFRATWKTPEDLPEQPYFFEVAGQSTGGNAFPPLRSAAFEVVPGVIKRTPLQDVDHEFERLGTGVFAMPRLLTDLEVGFTLAYFGAASSVQVQGFDSDPLSESAIPHTVDEAGGRYLVRFETDHETQVGAYRILMRGKDAHGNELAGESRIFILAPTLIGVSWDRFPPLSAFGEGKTITLTLTTKYAAGMEMNETHGRPSAVVLYEGRPVSQRPEVEWTVDRWTITWTAPDTLPDGEYVVAVGGNDLFGNTIQRSSSTPFPVATDLGSSFAKVIPGPSPALVALALCALAAILGATRRARREQ